MRKHSLKPAKKQETPQINPQAIIWGALFLTYLLGVIIIHQNP